MSWTSGPNAGNNVFNGGLGSDNDVADGLDGNDTLYGGDGDDSLLGGAGNDSLVGDIGSEGDPGRDSLSGGTGNDTLIGGLRNDTVLGGAGDDSLWEANVAISGNDSYLLGDGNDSFYSGSQNDRDMILAGDGNDSVVLNHDQHTGGRGSTLDGGAGDDTLSISIVASQAGRNTADFSLLGGAGNDSLRAFRGNDSLDGGSGDDTLDGGLGNDSIVISAGTDSLAGGGGDDIFSWSGGEGAATLDGGVGSDTLDLGADFGNGTLWTTQTDPGGFTTYSYNVGGGSAESTLYARNFESILCYAEGTRIATPRGEVAIERLRVGDQVLCAGTSSAAAAQPIIWIGRIHAELADHPHPERARPVLFRAGALGHGLPLRDLRVSPDHGMFFDGMLVPARLLVNGASIVQEAWWPAITYLHIELPEHAIILAEGAPSESWLDDGRRSDFDNAGRAAPFVDFGPDRTALRPSGSFPMADEAAAARYREAFAGLIRARTSLTDKADARLVVGDAVLFPCAADTAQLRFRLTAAQAESARQRGVGLASRIAATSAQANRMRGLAITGFELRAARVTQRLGADDVRLRHARGLAAPEGSFTAALRWTDGHARLPAALFNGMPAGALEFDVLLGEPTVFWAAA